RYAAKIGRPISRVPPEAMQRLVAYPWPGNVRELENVIERAVILSPGPGLRVAPEVLPVPAGAPGAVPVVPAASSTAAARGPAARGGGRAGRREVGGQHLVATLKQPGWRIGGPQGAARLLNLNPSTLRSRMQKLGIKRSAQDIS